MAESPFKFLDSFKKGEIHSFFGRDEEIDVIYTYLHESNVVLINGPSGTGKSSVVQCGLANRFEKTDWLDVFVRRHDDINKSLRENINEKNKKDFRLDANIIDCLKSLYLDYFKPIYLIFDQFEELFILGKEDEQTKFFNDLRAIINEKGIPCKVLLIMREKYIAQLQNFEKVIPEIFDKRVRIEYMRDDDIRTVIAKTCDFYNIQLDPRKETIDEIVKNLKIDENLVELPHLQIYLDRLWKEGNLSETNSVFSLNLVKKVGSIQNVLKAFLEERISEVNKNLVQKYPNAPKNAIEQLLINFTNNEGTKKPRKRGDVISGSLKKGIAYFIIDELVNQGILRLEKVDKNVPDSDDNIYEITHDTLAKIIQSQLSAENTQIHRAISIIKDGFSDYHTSNTFYFQRSFLDANQIREIELMTDKIKNNVPLKEQPNAEEWEIVDISRRYNFLKNSFMIFCAIIIIWVSSFFTSTRIYKGYEMSNILEKASSPTQKYLIYKKYDNEIILPSLFISNYSYIINEIKDLPEKENLYYLSIANNESINDVILLKIKQINNKKVTINNYFAVVGDSTLHFFKDKTGEKIASVNFNKQKAVSVDKFNIKLNISRQDSLSQNVATILDGNNNILNIIADNKANFQNVEILLHDIDRSDNQSINGFSYGKDGVIVDDTTHLEYKLDKVHYYSFIKSYKDDTLLIFADKDHGICRIFKSIKKNNTEIDTKLLPDEKLLFNFDLNQNDYDYLLSSDNSDIQSLTWQQLENEFIASDGFINGIFYAEKKKQNRENFENLLQKIIKKTDSKNIYSLWTNLYRKIHHQNNGDLSNFYNEDLSNFYKEKIKELEKKVGSFPENERSALFRSVRIQSKSGANNEHIVFLKEMHDLYKPDNCLTILLSIVYSNTSWFKLMDGKYKESIEYSKNAINLKVPKTDFYNINLGHGYLLNNELDLAKQTYLKFADSTYYKEVGCEFHKDNKLNRDATIQDLNDLIKSKTIPQNLIQEANNIKLLLSKKPNDSSKK